MNIDKKYRLEKCVSTDPSRVNMQNVHVTRRHGFSTNGHVLAAVPVEFEKEDTPGMMTVDALKLGRKITPKDFDHISIILNGQQILSDGTTMARPQTAEHFPKVGRIFLQTLRNRTMRIGLNVGYLRDLATALGSDEIILEISKPDCAVAVRPLHDNKAVGVIMPIRLHSKEKEH